jgi:hypothetical protein
MPVITVSRMFGSGGSEVAARIADGLGWTLLDNALVERVAAQLGRTPVEVQAIEERVPSLAERLADALALGSPEIVSPALSAPLPPTEERLLEGTERAIDEAVGLNDQGTADLFTEVSRGIDKWLWFVEAHSQSGIS